MRAASVETMGYSSPGWPSPHGSFTSTYSAVRKVSSEVLLSLPLPPAAVAIRRLSLSFWPTAS